MRSIVLLSFLALAVTACKKETSLPDKAAQLRGKWKISSSKRTSFYFYTQRDTTVDWFPKLPVCYKDDILTLREGFTGEVFYGAVSCTPAEQNIDEITWQVIQRDTVLEVNNAKRFFFGTDPMRGVLVGDVSNTFTIRYKNNEVDSFNRPELVTYENTYTRQ